MSGTRKIGTTRVIIDTDKSSEKNEKVQFSLHEKSIKGHIRKIGHEGLLEGISFMNFQVWKVLREVNGEDDGNTKTNSN